MLRRDSPKELWREETTLRRVINIPERGRGVCAEGFLPKNQGEEEVSAQRFNTPGTMKGRCLRRGLTLLGPWWERCLRRGLTLLGPWEASCLRRGLTLSGPWEASCLRRGVPGTMVGRACMRRGCT